MLLMIMSKQYWIQRFEKEEERNSKVSLKQMEVAKKEYKKSISKIDDEIRLWYSKYATDNNLTFQEAQKALSPNERKKIKMNLKEYIKLGEQQNIAFNPEIEKLLNKVSARVHVSRLEAIKTNLQAEIEMLYLGIDRGLGKHFNDVLSEGYARTSYLVQSMSGVYESINGINKDLVNSIIYKPWTSDGKNWSNRIWKQKDKLIDELHTSLTQSLVLGDDINLLVDKMSKRLDIGFSRVANLLMTESAAYHSKATELCYKDLEVEKYEILATLDTRTSNICQGMDGKIFDRKQYQVGVTAPPFHCRCRTTTIPYFEDIVDDETRAARDENNKHIEEKASMKYPEWKEKYYSENDEDPLKNNEKNDIIKEKINYKIVDKQIEEELQKRSDKIWKNKLTYNEQNAIREYSGPHYKYTNMYLRNLLEDSDIPDSLKQRVKILDDILSKNILDDDLILYRGVSLDEFNAWKDSDTITTYKSSSVKEIVSTVFGEGYRIIIHSPKNTKGFYLGSYSSFASEKEFLIHRGQKYKILKIEERLMEVEIIDE